MSILDVESLFTNISLKETVKIYGDSFYKNHELLPNINKCQFEEIVKAPLCNNYFLFDDIIYQQVDGGSQWFSFGFKLS